MIAESDSMLQRLTDLQDEVFTKSTAPLGLGPSISELFGLLRRSIDLQMEAERERATGVSTGAVVGYDERLTYCGACGRHMQAESRTVRGGFDRATGEPLPDRVAWDMRCPERHELWVESYGRWVRSSRARSADEP